MFKSLPAVKMHCRLQLKGHSTHKVKINPGGIQRPSLREGRKEQRGLEVWLKQKSIGFANPSPSKKKKTFNPVLVAHTCNPATQKAEIRRSMVWGQS
jgi:ribosomal protein L44E